MFFCLFFPKCVFAIADSATSAIVLDVDSGRVLYQKNVNEKRLIASITKIMTAVIAIENGNLTDVFTAGEEIMSMYGTNIYLQLGEEMMLLDLLYGLLLRSGNDAAVVIANHICKSEEDFVKLMNDKAKSLGMYNTVFNNSHGLDEVTENYSTAYDMAILSKYAYSLPIYREITKTKKWVVKGDNKTYVWNNRNKLLSKYSYATGGKNGYTPRAGRTLVTNASYNSLDLTAVTLNDPNYYDSHIAMYNYIFNKYKRYQILDQYTFELNDSLYGNKAYIKKSFYYPLMEEEVDDIKVVAIINDDDEENNNNIIGEIKVLLKDEEVYSDYIYLRESNVKIGFFQRIIKWFDKIF